LIAFHGNISIFIGMNIRDKLKFLDQINTPNQRQAPTLLVEYDIKDIISGEIIDQTFVVTHEFNANEKHGSITLEQIHDIAPYYLKLAGKDDNLMQIDLRKSLFFDTETTGLSGGSGTYIFLAGFGFFENNKFFIKQYFLRNLGEEIFMLKSIRQLLNKFESIVSFNGKSYDLPLLQDRFTFHRIPFDSSIPLHFDLLHASRRIWKNSLSDCTLNTIEKQILHVYRKGDIPSYLIPQIYFEYLRKRDARPLKAVFYHNKIDILSLVALTIKLYGIHKAPVQQLNNRIDLLTLARHYENMGQWEKNIPIYKTLLKSETNFERKKNISIQLAYCYKKSGDFENAESIWKELIHEGNFRIEPYEELAKYYEHHTKNLEQAHHIVQSALKNIDLLEQLRNDNHFSQIKKQLYHRLTRIRRKMLS